MCYIIQIFFTTVNRFNHKYLTVNAKTFFSGSEYELNLTHDIDPCATSPEHFLQQMESVDSDSVVVLGNPYENPHSVLRPRTLSTEYLSEVADNLKIRILEVTGAVNSYHQYSDRYSQMGYAFWPMYTVDRLRDHAVTNPVGAWTMYNHAGRWDRDCLLYMLDNFNLLDLGLWSHHESSRGDWPGITACVTKQVQDRARELCGRGNSGINTNGHPGLVQDWQDQICFDINMHSYGAACIMTETQTFDSWFVTEKLWRTFLLGRIPLVVISNELNEWLSEQGFWLPIEQSGSTYDQCRRIANYVNSNRLMTVYLDNLARLEENRSLAKSSKVMKKLQRGYFEAAKDFSLK